MSRMRTDTNRLESAEKFFRLAKEELQGINLRTYRGRDEQRAAIQEARNSADCGIDWSHEARVLTVSSNGTIDISEPISVG